MGELRIMNFEGDTKLIWDPSNQDEVEAAKEQFEKLKKKKFSAYKVTGEGGKGKKITRFDPKIEKIIMTPPIVGG